MQMVWVKAISAIVWISMRVMVVDNGSSYLQTLLNFLHEEEVVVFKWSSNAVLNAGSYDAVIFSGESTTSIIADEEKYEKEIALVKSLDKPILGVCLGFELIAYSYGAQMKHVTVREALSMDIRIVKHDPIFNHIPVLQVYGGNRWVIDSLGVFLETLGKSDEGIEIVKHKDKMMYGLQLQPEVIVDKTISESIFRNFISTAKSFAFRQRENRF